MEIIEVSQPQSLLVDILQITRSTLGCILKGKINKKILSLKLYEFANESLGIVLICVSFMGIIITIEYSHHMHLAIGDDSLVPTFSMIMLTRELAPAIAAMLIVSRMGASIAAEIGSMKTSEQLDAYRLLGLNPIEMFVVPQTIASALACVALTTISLFCAVIGGWLAGVSLLHFTTGTYFNNLLSFTHPMDFYLGGVKALLFGASIPLISSAHGFRCQHGSEGVGLATTNAVVTSSIWIIILDFILTYIFSFL